MLSCNIKPLDKNLVDKLPKVILSFVKPKLYENEGVLDQDKMDKQPFIEKEWPWE